MNTLRADDLQAFFNERGKNGNQARKGGLAPKTLTNLRNMMHMAFGQAVKNHLLQENLIEGIRLPKATKTEMRVLSREEQRRLMTAARLAAQRITKRWRTRCQNWDLVLCQLDIMFAGRPARRDLWLARDSALRLRLFRYATS